MTTVSVVIPVKNGARYLGEVLTALARERADEVLVIDSGSSDGSFEIARAAGVSVRQIPPAQFGHGSTRNLGVEQTRGELVCFLTQDATPVPGWLDAFREAMALDPRVGAAFGPHLPRPDTSPMIARELTEFFATFGANEHPVVQRLGDPPFLSNVNACYLRECWEEVRFRELEYAEDQAFAADMLAAGWVKVFQPRAAVLHAHDFRWSDFMRRYFDEYRGLRESIAHVEPFGVRSVGQFVGASVARDLRWMKQQDMPSAQRVRWAARSFAHHGGRRVFSALGSRSDRLPPPARKMLSLERRAGGPMTASSSGPAPGQETPPPLPHEHVAPALPHEHYELVARVWREGPAPLADPVPGMSDRDRLRIAMVIPVFSRGSGGHQLLFELFSRLERRGHACSVWVHDYSQQLRDTWAGVLRHDIVEFFSDIRSPVYKGFDEWHGADVVVATGWQTVHPALLLPGCRARAYLVNDHEPEFYATSAESVIAQDTYRHGFHCIAGSPWLKDLLRHRYGTTADAITYGVEHTTYRPRPVQRRDDTVVFYARHVTPRRAVPIGLLALAELYRRRSDVRIVLYGSERPSATSFPHEHMGVLTGRQLSWLYSEATVGLSISLTNFSLSPKEMMACGLPCVEIAGRSAESIFGKDGPIELAELDPTAIASSLQRLLEDRELRQRRSAEGASFVAAHTWDRAAEDVEKGLRHALRLREGALV